DHFLGMIRGQESTTRCLWFDPQTRKCRHHEWRPQVCRDYEMGGDECLALRRRFLVPAVKAPATAERQEPG
ncbi:MAG: YkgJ family cysteine cluster protein, partial [Planctomycetales bacterium]